MIKLLLAFTFSTFILSSAANADQCPASNLPADFSLPMVANRFGTVSLGCLVQITPINKPELVYREYYFDEHGRFLIYHSVQGDAETSTATQAYFFFPRLGVPTVELQKGAFKVTTSAGFSVTVATSEAKVQSMDKISFAEPSGPVSLNREGMLSVQSYAGLWLDAGYRIGGLAYWKPDAKSTFRDEVGQSCEVTNREIFDSRAQAEEPVLLHETDAKLGQFLKTRCPGLSVQSLTSDSH